MPYTARQVVPTSRLPREGGEMAARDHRGGPSFTLRGDTVTAAMRGRAAGRRVRDRARRPSGRLHTAGGGSGDWSGGSWGSQPGFSRARIDRFRFPGLPDCRRMDYSEATSVSCLRRPVAAGRCRVRWDGTGAEAGARPRLGDHPRQHEAGPQKTCRRTPPFGRADVTQSCRRGRPVHGHSSARFCASTWSQRW